MNGSTEWSTVLNVGVGLGALLAGLGILVMGLRLGGVLKRLERTLDEVDSQLASLTPPVVQTLKHVGGIADTADATIARLGAVVGALENVAGSIAKTANLAQNAVSPALVNIGATLTGITTGLRRIVRGGDSGEIEREH